MFRDFEGGSISRRPVGSRVQGIEQVWHNAKLRGRGYNRAATIISFSESSVGIKHGANTSKRAVKWFVERILELDKQLSDIEEQLNQKCKKFDDVK